MNYIDNETTTCDTHMNIRINRNTLEKFKRYAPKYQTKIKELMNDYIKRCENIETRERKARESYMEK